jgi:hypothetical protein
VVHGGPEVGQAISTDPAVRFVNFTGSGRVAEQILKDIGLKRTLMELGGNVPTIVHRDAALSTAARICADVVQQLLAAGLIDELRLLVHPVAARSGKRLFDEGNARYHLRLLKSETFPMGVVRLLYAPAPGPGDRTSYFDLKK